MIAKSDHLFLQGMADSWQHSQFCLNGRADVCICGLTALQALAAKAGRRVFHVVIEEAPR